MEAALRRIGPAPKRLEIMGNAAQIWMQQGREEGKAEGLAAGEELGRAKGKAEDLTRLLKRRFGPLPSAIKARIAAASVPELDAWLDSLLDATSLEEVFAGSSGH